MYSQFRDAVDLGKNIGTNISESRRLSYGTSVQNDFILLSKMLAGNWTPNRRIDNNYVDINSGEQY